MITTINNSRAEVDDLLKPIRHCLPAQAPLKDFVHHNTLHAFQHLPFSEAVAKASVLFGYKTRLSLNEYRLLFQQKKISENVLASVLKSTKGTQAALWHERMVSQHYHVSRSHRIGKLRALWKKHYKIDIDNYVHPILFRLVCNYLDQGIAIWKMPIEEGGFLDTIRELDKRSFDSLFKTTRARHLLHNGHHGGKIHLDELLTLIVGDSTYHQQYLFDQQFAHQGWSGMVNTIEQSPAALLDARPMSLHDFIVVELLLELDAVDYALGTHWRALSDYANEPIDMVAPTEYKEIDEVLMLWQQAYEWTYYDSVLAGIKQQESLSHHEDDTAPTFQAIFCIDDRECSLRRYIEQLDKRSETFGTPGFFNVAFYYQPENGKFTTKLCPAPVTPTHLIKEIGSTYQQHKEDFHMKKHTHSLLGGWLISQTVGFWAALRLFVNIFKPQMSSTTTTSLRYTDAQATLTIEHDQQWESGLQVGFTVDEMTDRIESLLKSIGLVNRFASLVYIVGHGASSVNNPHYAAYDCGACCGRPGSVNARVAAYMANHTMVRKHLAKRGLHIPDGTHFVAALHDTTRDEMVFYEETELAPELQSLHTQNKRTMTEALYLNAKERSRRFDLVNTSLNPKAVHKRVEQRSVSLFEPRPELNHATNSLCIVGRRAFTKKLFLDRRAFMNSYDYHTDPEGKYLLQILKAAAPVCGGINLEYYFSRIDNYKLGAGTKLPHNVMGLIGVANGIDGDLRPGLPSQMIEVHDLIRILIIVEHHPDVVLSVIKQHSETYEWFKNEWVNLVVYSPDDKQFYRYADDMMTSYKPAYEKVNTVKNLTPLIESSSDNIPVTLIG